MVNLFRRTQPIATKITDRLLIGLAYVPVLCLWLYGYFGLGMPWWDFAVALVVFGLLKTLLRTSCYDLFNDVASAVIVGIGVFVFGIGIFFVFNSDVVRGAGSVVVSCLIGCLGVVVFLRPDYDKCFFYCDPLAYAVCFFPYSRLWLLRWLMSQGEISRFKSMCAYTATFLSPFVLCLIFLPIYIFFLRGSRKEQARWNYVTAYPALLCPVHHARPTRRRNALFYSDVACRHKDCQSESFEVGIKQVVGVIGDITQERTGETFYVSVWNEAEQQGHNADLDVLEIRAADHITNYDHVIDAVLAVLRNDLSRPKDYLKHVPVYLKDVQVSEQARRSLQAHFARIEDI